VAQPQTREDVDRDKKQGGFHLNPTVIISTVVAAALIAYIVSLAAQRNSWPVLWSVLQQTWLLILGLTIPYLAFRAVAWRMLLDEIGIALSWLQLLVPFSAGEMTKNLPGGIYLENYLLGKVKGGGRTLMVRSSAATTATLGLEAMLAMPVALVVRIPGAQWVFWTLVAVSAAWIMFLAAVWFGVGYWDRHWRGKGPHWLTATLDSTRAFLAAGLTLVTPRTLLALLPTACYMILYAIALYAIVLAIGVHSVGFVQTMGVYALMILGGILDIVPSDIGVADLAGLETFRAYGVASSDAAVIILSFRILATGINSLVAGGIFLVSRVTDVSTHVSTKNG